MKVVSTWLDGLVLLEPTVFGDDRGFFFETWNARALRGLGIDAAFVQDNHSRSAKGVLRGLHYQIKQPQGKLVRVISGAVYDVAVDIRRGSETFGQWIGTTLSAANKRVFWIPAGFAHAFLSLKDGTEFLYKCTDYYELAFERSIAWNDPHIGIRWPLEDIGTPSLSAKDAAGVALRDAEVFA